MFLTYAFAVGEDSGYAYAVAGCEDQQREDHNTTVDDPCFGGRDHANDDRTERRQDSPGDAVEDAMGFEKGVGLWF